MREFLITLVRRLSAVVAECNYAQRRMTTLATCADRALLDPRQAPDTYQEFLLRTTGRLAHEPPAAKRPAKRPAR